MNPQVIHHMGQSGVTSAQELEATLGLRLEHENIVRTYDYATRTNGPVSVSCTPDFRTSGVHNSN